MNETKKKYVIFYSEGGIGNSLFRYFASILFCIKYDYEYILQEDFHEYIFYKGVDCIDNDVEFCKNKSIDELKRYCSYNNYDGFNTLGFIKNNININNLKPTLYINQNNEHDIYIRKKILCIDDYNYYEKLYKCNNDNLLHLI
jgi:hypothetical protein